MAAPRLANVSTTSSVPAHTDDESGGDYPEDLYRFDHVATTVPAPDRFDDLQVQRYRDEGYLAVSSLLSQAEVDDTLDALAAVLADPGAAGAVQYESWARAGIEELTPAERMDAVRKFMWFTGHEPRLHALAHSERIRSLVAQFAGMDGPQDMVLFQDMALLKPPGGGREKPWHQDNAYFTFEPGTPIVGVWIALDAATAANGCMHVRPGTHREGPVVHFRRRDWQICDTDVQPTRDVTVPLEPGGALFFDGLIHHGTPANRSDTRRRAVQFHYVPASVEHVSEERRLTIFGSEGKGVTC